MKKKLFLFLMVATLFVCGIMLVGCSDPEPETYSVTWNVDSHATVTAEGYNKLPESVKAGTEITFTVTCENGYKVDKVTFNDKTQHASKGAYTVAVNSDSTISVVTAREIDKIEVTAEPSKLTYYAGDELDTTGMEVKVFYKTNESETIAATDYICYPEVFEGGEDHFTVSYNGYETDVELDQVVEYKVTLKLNGGTISAEGLEALEAQHNYAYNNDADEITFTYYNNLPEDGLVLPTAENFTKAGNVFYSWTGNVSNITNSTGSITLSAVWDPAFLTLNSMYLEVREGTPYLNVTGTFGAGITEVQLYLLHGSKNIELYGPTVSRGDTDEFTMIFDLTQLAAKEEAKLEWMDIRFMASTGDSESAETQQIFLNKPNEELDVDIYSFIRCDGKNYLFQTWTNNDSGSDEYGLTSLKLVYNDVNPHVEYSLSIADEDGVPTLTVAGKVDEDCLERAAGGTITIDAESSSNYSKTYFNGDIASNGTFTVKVDLTEINQSVYSWVHVTIKDSEDGQIHTGNLLHYGSTTPFESVLGNGEFKDAITFEKDGFEYYVGYSDVGEGGGIRFQVFDRRLVINSFELKEVDGNVHLVLTGTTTFTEADFAEDGIAAQYNIDFEMIGGSYTTVFPVRVSVQISNGQITITYNLSDLKLSNQETASFDNANYIMHVYDLAGNKGNFYAESNSQITVGDKTYSLNYKNGDYGWNVYLKVAAA